MLCLGARMHRTLIRGTLVRPGAGSSQCVCCGGKLSLYVLDLYIFYDCILSFLKEGTSVFIKVVVFTLNAVY